VAPLPSSASATRTVLVMTGPLFPYSLRGTVRPSTCSLALNSSPSRSPLLLKRVPSAGLIPGKVIRLRSSR